MNTPSSPSSAVRYDQVMPQVLGALAAVHPAIDALGLPRTLHHLVQLRASQINRCAYCIRMHTKEARADGESNERLDRLVVWEQVADFTAAEKAALAWTEALTLTDAHAGHGDLRARLREFFSDAQIGALTATVAMINLWNRIQRSAH